MAPLQRVAGVEVALAVDHVATREQDLPARDALSPQHVGVDLGERCLATGGACLQAGYVGRTLLKAQALHACCRRARRDHHHALAQLAQCHHLAAEVGDEGPIHGALSIHERR